MKKLLVTGLTLFSLSLLITPLAGITSSSAANSESQMTAEDRIVKKAPWRAEPVRVTGLYVNSRAISLDRPFNGDDNWMQGFRFSVKNTSNKNISYMRFELLFPLTDDRPRPHYFASVMEFGKELPNGDAMAEPLKPGDTTRLSFNPVDVESLKKTISKYTKTGRLLNNTAQLSTEIVQFDDGTAWSADDIFRFNKSTNEWDRVGSALAVISSLVKHLQVGYSITAARASGTSSPQVVSCGGGRSPQCYKATIVQVTCDCTGTNKNVSEPGDEACSGVSAADKSVTCPATTGCIQEVIFYNGTAAGCVTP